MDNYYKVLDWCKNFQEVDYKDLRIVSIYNKRDEELKNDIEIQGNGTLTANFGDLYASFDPKTGKYGIDQSTLALLHYDLKPQYLDLTEERMAEFIKNYNAADLVNFKLSRAEFEKSCAKAPKVIMEEAKKEIEARTHFPASIVEKAKTFTRKAIHLKNQAMYWMEI